MTENEQLELKARFTSAVESFIDKVQDDPNVIAIIVGGSLAYDVIWEKSDIDMTVVIRDQQLKNDSYSIIEDGVLINVHLIARSMFKRGMEKSIGGSFVQSYYAKGKIVYTNDDSLYEYFEEIKTIGNDDIALSLFYKACFLIQDLEKCEKWLKARNDTNYAQYYLLKMAETIASMEVCMNGEPTSRESMRRALELNPGMLATFYHDAMSHHYSIDEIVNSIDKVDKYIEKHLEIIKKPVLEFMEDQEIKTSTMIAKYFHMESHFIIAIFEYLVDKGVIEKVSQTIRITPKSKPFVEELGYIYIA